MGKGFKLLSELSTVDDWANQWLGKPLSRIGEKGRRVRGEVTRWEIGEHKNGVWFYFTANEIEYRVYKIIPSKFK